MTTNKPAWDDTTCLSPEEYERLDALIERLPDSPEVLTRNVTAQEKITRKSPYEKKPHNPKALLEALKTLESMKRKDSVGEGVS